jgi:hypothetical protein
MWLANPNIKITCIENINYNFSNYLATENKTKLYRSNNDEERYNILLSIENKNYDLIHISQIYPERNLLFPYLNWIADNIKNNSFNIIIDDVEVYPSNYKDIFLNININCKILKEEKSNCIYPNVLLKIKKCKKYFLIYNDETGKYDYDILKLKDSVIKYSDFEIIEFYKKDINSFFTNKNMGALTCFFLCV